MTEIAEKAKTWLESPITYRVFQLIAVISLLVGLAVGVNQYQLTSCLADYNEASNKATAARTDAAAADRKALDDMVQAIVDARALPSEEAQQAVQKALTGYLVARASADGQRKGSPLPAPPSQTCG